MEIATRSKKRKHLEDEDNEEEKMEEFFALVKNIRDARDRLMSGSNGKKQITAAEDVRFDDKRKMDDDEENKAAVQVWKPTFQYEDFLEGISDDQLMKNNVNPNNHVSAVAAASSSSPSKKTLSKQESEKEEIKEGLDLRLSL